METGKIFTSENLQQLHQLCCGKSEEEKSYTDKLLQILQGTNYEPASNLERYKTRVDEYKTRLGQSLTFEGIRFLEKFYQRHKIISTIQVITLARNLKVAPAKIKRWFRKRAKKDENCSSKENTEYFEDNANISEAQSSNVVNPCILQEYSSNQNTQYPWNFAPYNFSHCQSWTPYVSNVSDTYTNSNYPSEDAGWSENPPSTNAPVENGINSQIVSTTYTYEAPDHNQDNFYFNVPSPWQENGMNLPPYSDGSISNYGPPNLAWTNNLQYFPQQ